MQYEMPKTTPDFNKLDPGKGVDVMAYVKRRVSAWAVHQMKTTQGGASYDERVSYKFRHIAEAREQLRLCIGRNPDKRFFLKRTSQTIIAGSG